LLVTADLVVNLIAGALPAVFTIAAAVLVGRVPAAVWGGLHSRAWSALLIAFVFTAVAFIGQQVAAPVREAAGQVLARRIDGRIINELMAASTSTEGRCELIARTNVGLGDLPRVITVLVSHRFSTVWMADLIGVLRDGRVKEFGDHDTPIKNGGLYAELCALQARAYS